MVHACASLGDCTTSNLTHIELHITELASPAWPLDLEDSLPVCIHEGEPGVDEGAVLLDVANSGASWRLDLHLLQAAEAAPGIAPVRTNQVDDLQKNTWKHKRATSFYSMSSQVPLSGCCPLWSSQMVGVAHSTAEDSNWTLIQRCNSKRCRGVYANSQRPHHNYVVDCSQRSLSGSDLPWTLLDYLLLSRGIISENKVLWIYIVCIFCDM